METGRATDRRTVDPRAPERRAPVSKKRRRRAQVLPPELTLLQNEYPEFFKPVQTAVDAVLYRRDRTREGDRETARRVLAEWDATGLVVGDLVEECEYLSRWDLGEVSKEIGHLVEYRDEYGAAGASDRPRRIIRLRRGTHSGWRESDAHARAVARGRGGEVPAHG